MFKSATIIIGTSVAIAGWPLPSTAQSTDPVQQLLSTRACPGCDFSNRDLSGQDLSQVDLQGAQLTNTNLSNANLSNANLSNANLTGANLYLANLSNANLDTANLNQTKLSSANLEGANLTNAQIENATFSYANLKRATLTGSQLNKANLSDADLEGAIATQANFTGATLRSTNLSNANLAGANLSQAVLIASDLTETNLTDANLEEADLRGAKLDRATLTNTNLSNAKLEKTLLADASSASGAAPQTIGQTPETEKSEQPTGLTSPLRNQKFRQSTAYTLPRGAATFNFTGSLYTLSADVAGNNDTSRYAGLGFSVGITDDLELTGAYQQVDSNSPGRQGPFIVNRAGSLAGETPGNDEFTLQLKQKIWKNADRSLELSGLAAVSFAPGPRRNTFRDGAVTIQKDNSAIVPELQLPLTATLGKRTTLTLAPTIAFFPSDSALFLSTAPGIGGSFGTTFGFVGAASYQVFDRLTLWADAFVPLTGNNSISPNSGRPSKEIAFNAGLRYLVNPRLALDVFATNTEGSVGPVALTTQPNSIGVGANLVFMPDFIPGNRRIADNHGGTLGEPDSPRTIDGLGFFDGGTVPKGKLAFNLQGGSQGLLTALRVGVLKDFELGVFFESISGRVDESEQGFSGKVRLLNQDKGAPFTLSLAGTVSITNDVFANFNNNDRTAFEALGIPEGTPFIGNLDRGNRLFLVTATLPMHYRINDRANVWFTPTLGIVQRSGLEAAGFNLGGEFEVIPAFSVLAEVGADLVGKGNAFSGNRLVDRLPWNFAVRVDPLRLFNNSLDSSSRANRPNIEVYITNRVGSSTWHQLRVRDQNDIAVGAGILIPF
ncbi:MAG: pentapeptide repeat-containing protein [Thermosynechococcaceae cyanobacterium]